MNLKLQHLLNDETGVTGMAVLKAILSGERILTFYKTWQRACKEAGISAKRLVHDFRRTAVRNLVRAGVRNGSL